MMLQCVRPHAGTAWPLAVGVTSYDGHVFYGLEADRDAVPDVDVLAQCITESLSELVDTTTDSRARAPRGRTKPNSSRSGRTTTKRPNTRKRTT